MKKLFFIIACGVLLFSCQKDDQGLHLTENINLQIKSHDDKSVTLQWSLTNVEDFSQYRIVMSEYDLNNGYGGSIVEFIDDYYTLTYTVTNLGLASPLYFRVDIMGDNEYKESNIVSLEREFETFEFNSSIYNYLYFPNHKQFVLASSSNMYYIDCSNDQFTSGNFNNSAYHDGVYKGISAQGIEELWQIDNYYLNIFDINTHNKSSDIYINYYNMNPFGVQPNGDFYMHDEDDEIYFYDRSTGNQTEIHYNYNWDIEGACYNEIQNELCFFHGYYHDYLFTKAALGSDGTYILSTQDIHLGFSENIEFIEHVNNGQNYIHGPGLKISNVNFTNTIDISSSIFGCYVVKDNKVYYNTSVNEIKIYDIATNEHLESIFTLTEPVCMGFDGDKLLVLEKDPESYSRFIVEAF